MLCLRIDVACLRRGIAFSLSLALKRAEAVAEVLDIARLCQQAAVILEGCHAYPLFGPRFICCRSNVQVTLSRLQRAQGSAPGLSAALQRIYDWGSISVLARKQSS